MASDIFTESEELKIREIARLVIAERRVQIERDVTELRTEIFGNGGIGLKVRVQKIEDTCASIFAPLWKKMLFGVLQTVIAAMVLAIIAWEMGMFKTHP